MDVGEEGGGYGWMVGEEVFQDPPSSEAVSEKAAGEEAPPPTTGVKPDTHTRSVKQLYSPRSNTSPQVPRVITAPPPSSKPWHGFN